MVVVVVIAIIVVIARSNMQSGRKSANEASTIAYFKQAVVSNEQYRVRHGRFASSFNALVNSGYFADGQNPSGYTLVYYPGTDSWAFEGDPEISGETGDRYFYVDEMGVIRASLSGTADSTSTPLQGKNNGNGGAEGGETNNL